MKKLFYKIGIFVLAIAIAQIAMYEYIVPQIPEISTLDRFLGARTDILYFGDSVIKYADPSDSDHSSISEMLARSGLKGSLGDVSRDGYLPSIYEAMMEYVSHSKEKPKAIVLPINLASLSTAWYKVPGEQFEKERFILTAQPVLLRNFWRPLAITGAVRANTISEEEFQKTSVYYGTKVLGTVFDFLQTKKFSATAEEEARSSYILRYMGALTEDSPALDHFKKIIDLAKRNGIQIYAYVTPINHERGVRAVGNDFLVQTRHNIAVACSIFEKSGFPCLDLAFAVRSADFQFPDGRASEHLRQKGRMIVASRLATLFK